MQIIFLLQTKGDRPLEAIIAEHTSKLQKKSLLFSGSSTQFSTSKKVGPEKFLSADDDGDNCINI